MERFDLVQKAYDELKASGVVRDFDVVQPEGVLDDMKGAVTLRAAYYINQVNPNRGLLAKTSGTNYRGFKADVIMDKDGTTFDISTDNGKKIIMQNPGGNAEPNLIPLWRQPTKELAGLDSDSGNNNPPIEDPTIREAIAEIKANQTLIMNSLASSLQVLQQVRESQGLMHDTLQLILDKPIEIRDVKFPDYEIKGNAAFNKLFGTVTATKKVS